jgi:hypothetical protein
VRPKSDTEFSATVQPDPDRKPVDVDIFITANGIQIGAIDDPEALLDRADIEAVWGKRYESADLQLWFGLSHASFLVLPRVLMEAMPIDWQDKMAGLLMEYDKAFPNQPDIGTRVQITQDGKLIRTPAWLINYRRPDKEAIDKLRGE